MADIYPFRALHYSPKLVPELERTVTQPYDKISSEMQGQYYELSPYNLVRIIRGRQNAADGPEENVYVRARNTFRDWISEGVLTSELEPALYPYDQEYCVPGSGEVWRRRRGFIALCRIEDYTSKVVHRHEETLSGPKVDRLELIKVTRAHFGQIFVLYSDPEGFIESRLAGGLGVQPWQRARDEHGTVHNVWRVCDPSIIEQVINAMRDRKLVIADGHHRYETAMAYRNLCRAQAACDDRAEYVMMTFVRKECEGLTILPTHRVVHGLRSFDWQKFKAAAQRFFDCEEVPVITQEKGWTGEFAGLLAESGRERPTFGVYAGPNKVARLRLRIDAEAEELLKDFAPGLQRLDVVVLHRLILETLLGIDRIAVKEERNLCYVRDILEAIHQVESGEGQVSFLMNPTPIESVWENALAGNVLPQKSTDFYPKLLSGFTIYWLDNPAGM